MSWMMVVTGDGAEERVDSLLKRGCLSSSLEISMKSEWRAGQRAEKHAFIGWQDGILGIITIL